MIVSPGRGYIFVHIPKTGGTSLALALEDRAHRDDILIGDTPKAVKRRNRLKGLTSKGRLWKHSTLADIEGILPQDELDALKVFTMVRNPWDRLVSYYHWLQDQSFLHPAVALAKSLEFDRFLTHPVIVKSMQMSSYPSYVTGSCGTEKDAVFLKLEEPDAALDAFEQHLGFRPDLGHENKSDRDADWRVYYTDESAEQVAQMCATDIKRFNYRFNPKK